MHFSIRKNNQNFHQDKSEEALLPIYPFRENKNLCVSHQIKFYFDKMKEFHKIKVQILLSFTKSHKGVTIPYEFRYLIYRELTPKFSPVTQQGLLALQNPKHQVYVQIIYYRDGIGFRLQRLRNFIKKKFFQKGKNFNLVY